MFSREIGAQSSTSVWYLICSQTTPPRSAGARGGRRGRARLSYLPGKSVRGTPCSDSVKSSSFKQVPFSLYKKVKRAFKCRGGRLCPLVISHGQGVPRSRLPPVAVLRPAPPLPRLRPLAHRAPTLENYKNASSASGFSAWSARLSVWGLCRGSVPREVRDFCVLFEAQCWPRWEQRPCRSVLLCPGRETGRACQCLFPGAGGVRSYEATGLDFCKTLRLPQHHEHDRSAVVCPRGGNSPGGCCPRPFADPEHEAFSPGLHVDGFPVFPFLQPAEP